MFHGVSEALLRSAALVAVFVFLVVLGLARNAASAKKQVLPPLVLHMTAKDFEFDPSEIHVRQGTTVQLLVTSMDHTHGIRISPFPDGRAPNTPPGLSFPYGQDCYKLKKGDQVTVEFTAYDPGTYSFQCCKACGSGHNRMVGKIIVDRVK